MLTEDMLLQSLEIQRVLEGEKAERSETARQIKELTRQLPLYRSSAHQEDLKTRLASLNEQLSRQSQQVNFRTCGSVLPWHDLATFTSSRF